LWKRSLNEYDDSVNSAVIGAINQSLTKSEEDMVQSKVQSYLSTADSKWLDYWGYWFGERRKSNWDDDYYRERIVNHVKHSRGTVDGLRDAIADFINTNRDNIFIYEPYRDMFIWNSSEYNTKKYFSSTYYRYAVIDIQVSSSYPKEIVSIINLFRPAGVLWVLTETINSRNSDAPIIDIKNPKEVFVPKIENDFIFGLRKRTRLVINPSNDEFQLVTNPFRYNEKDSIFNDSNSLLMGATQIDKRYSFIGNSVYDYTPQISDSFSDSSYSVEQLSGSDITSLSTKNGRGKQFTFSPVKNNLINNASKYLNPTKITDYNTNYSMPTNYLSGGNTYNFAVNLNSKSSLANTTSDLIIDSIHKNLLRDTANQSSDDWYTKNTAWTSDMGTYLGSKVNRTSGAWKNARYSFSSVAPLINLTDTYTYSIYVKVTGVDPSTLSSSYALAWECSATDANGKWTRLNTLSGNDWQRVSQSFKFTTNVSDSANIYAQSLRFELASNLPDGVSISFAAMKLEKGTTATDYSPAPEDNPSEKSDTQIKQNLSTVVKEGSQWLTSQFSIPDNFDIDTGPYIRFSGSDSNFEIDVSKPIIKNAINTNPMSWAQSSDDNISYPKTLSEIVDVKSYVNDKLKTLDTSTTNKDINDMFDTKKVHIVMRSSNVPDGEQVVVKVFNFNTNIWVTYNTLSINGIYNDFFIKMDDITPLLNSDGIMYINFILKEDSNAYINVDYIGVSLSNSEDGYSVQMWADQSNYDFEPQVSYGPFIVSVSQVSKAFVNPSRYKIGDLTYGRIGRYPLS